MGWTAIPAAKVTGYLVTASDWNTFIFDNVAYLKGQDGEVAFEDDIAPSSDGGSAAGTSSKIFSAGYFGALYAGSKGQQTVRLGNMRQIVLNWDDTESNWPVSSATGGGGTILAGGTGQFVIKVDDDAVGTADIYNQTEQNSAKDTSFNASRSPYMRWEFNLDHFDPATTIMIGFEDTPAAATVWTANDKLAGIAWSGGAATWIAENSDGGGSYDSTVITAYFTADQRTVVEILVVSATAVYIFIDGTLRHTSTTKLPTGDLEWVVHVDSDGSGGATDDSFLTLGQFVLQEALS